MCEAAEMLKVSRTTLITILKKREEIERNFGEGSRKRRRSGKDAAVGTALVQWIGAASQKNAPLSGPLMMEKALDLAKIMVKEDFKATTGWLRLLKKREGLKHKKRHGDGEGADEKAYQQSLKKVWPSLKSRFKEEDIFNAHESGLYFRALPDSTFTFKDYKRKGGKKSKGRITVHP